MTDRQARDYTQGKIANRIRALWPDQAANADELAWLITGSVLLIYTAALNAPADADPVPTDTPEAA